MSVCGFICTHANTRIHSCCWTLWKKMEKKKKCMLNEPQCGSMSFTKTTSHLHFCDATCQFSCSKSTMCHYFRRKYKAAWGGSVGGEWCMPNTASVAWCSDHHAKEEIWYQSKSKEIKKIGTLYYWDQASNNPWSIWITPTCFCGLLAKCIHHCVKHSCTVAVAFKVLIS